MDERVVPGVGGGGWILFGRLRRIRSRASRRDVQGGI